MTSQRVLALWAVLGILVSSVQALPARAADLLPGADPVVTVIPEGLVVEWNAPGYQVNLLNDGTAEIAMPGFNQVSLPGAPRLPFASALVALPTGADPVVEVLEINESQAPLSAPLALAGKPEGVLRDANGDAIGGQFAPASAVPFSPEPVVLEPAGTLRGVRLARLLFYPARPQGSSLRLTTHIKILLRMPARAAGSYQRTADPLIDGLSSQVINPQDISPARPPASSILPETSSLSGPSAGPAAAVEVSQPGLVEITFTGLLAAGFPVASINPNSLQLTRNGKAIAMEWQGDSDAQFENGERLLFFAEPRSSRYSTSDVYLLQTAASPARMGSRPANPGGLAAGAPHVQVVAEQNLLYTPDCYCAPIPAGRDGDRWVWDRLVYPSSAQGAYPVTLPSVDKSRAGQLDLWLIGVTDLLGVTLDHRVAVSFNGAPLGTVEWDGKQAVHATFTIPGAALNEGANSLALSLPGIGGVSIEDVWLDAFSVQYARSAQAAGSTVLFSGEGSPKAYTIALNGGGGFRAYDVTDPEKPVRLSGVNGATVTIGDAGASGVHRYWALAEAAIQPPARLRLLSPLQAVGSFAGADLIIISPAAFMPALSELVSLRQSQGLSVVVEDVQAIYDTYGGGRVDPAAIYNYLLDAYTHWNTQPTYVLLVGDGTYDPKRYLSSSTVTFIPPYLAVVDPWAGETAADNRYVTLEGSDNLPELLIGRLPVNSLAETAAVVRKIVDYETKYTWGGWSWWFTLVADNPDGGGDFPAATESIAVSRLKSPVVPRRLYFKPPATSPDDIRRNLLSSWNAGTGLILYTGHSSIHQWAAEQFIHLVDIPKLVNASRLPVVLEMTCFTASFHVPGLSSFDEALLRSDKGGAVAVWGPTGLGLETGHTQLADGFLKAVLQNAPLSLGAATLEGRLQVVSAAPHALDLIDTYTLLGDPATRFRQLNVPIPAYIPLVR